MAHRIAGDTHADSSVLGGNSGSVLSIFTDGNRCHPGPGTPSLGAFTSGIKLARSLGFYVFVTPLIEVDGPQPWAGAIHFPTEAQERLWFEHYWQAIKPYVLAAAGAGVEQ